MVLAVSTASLVSCIVKLNKAHRPYPDPYRKVAHEETIVILMGIFKCLTSMPIICYRYE